VLELLIGEVPAVNGSRLVFMPGDEPRVPFASERMELSMGEDLTFATGPRPQPLEARSDVCIPVSELLFGDVESSG
jgi:hypothetical protein